VKLETRAVLELRAKGRSLEGYIAKFNVEARIDDYVETIAPGAFANSLASGQDIVALADHDPSALLGRTASGTLSLREDSAGLAFSLAVPATQRGNDMLALAERGDLGGASFGFLPVGETWDGNRRTLTEVDLREISVVSAWPAYEGTEVIARAATPRLALARLYLETCR